MCMPSSCVSWSVDCYGLLLHDSDTTHQLGGTLDAVITDRSQLLSLMSVCPIIICCNGLFLPLVPRRPSRSYKLDRGGS